MTRKTVPAFVVVASVVRLAAQAPGFEVASVKPSIAMAGKPSIVRDPGGGFTASNVDLQTLILLAYHVQGYQLKGGPGWIRADRFDLAAKAPAGARKDQTWDMLQRLLGERFHLSVHKETVEMPVYLLTVAKGGLKIKPAERPREEIDGFFQTGPGRVKLRMAPLDHLAFALGDELGKRVLDRTGVTGNFDLQLEWTPETTIASALQEQLGLKLETSRGPVEVLVIDQVEKPSAN